MSTTESHADTTPATTTTAVGCPPPSPGLHRSGPGPGRTVALTFDDGPGPSTPATLDVLEHYGVRATFFNVGEHMQANPDLVRRMAADGDLLGNHTWDHPHMAGLPAADQGAEMDAATATQLAIVGTAPCVFRPPYGSSDDTTIAQANARGMTAWTWSLSTEDWMADASASSEWVSRIVTRAEAGINQQHVVILMHNGPAPGDPPAAAGGDPATVAALPTIIAFYRAHGYAFVDLLGRRGYTPQAPTGMAAPAAATTRSGMHVFVRDTTGGVVERTWRNGRWSPSRALGGDTVAGPAAARLSPTSALVAVTSRTHRVSVRTVNDSGVSGWTSLGGSSLGRPAVAADPRTGVVTVVVRTAKGALAFRQRVHGHWRSWSAIGGTFVTSPAVVMTPDHRVTVAAATADGQVWVRSHHTWWSPWRRIGSVTTADPALSSTADGAHLVLAFRTATGSIDRRVGTTSGGSWTTAKSLAGTSVSGPALTISNGHPAVLAVAPSDAVIWVRARDDHTLLSWTGWSSLPLTSR